MAETITKEIAMSLKHGDMVYHKILKQGPKGARVPIRARVSGRCQTWKRTSNRFCVPIKWGLYESWSIDQNNMHEWEIMK
jgi:hypothetical protein